MATRASAIVGESQLLSSGAWVAAGKLLTVGGSFIVNGMLARLLSPDEMATYFLAFSLVTAAAIVGQLGLNQTLVRIVAESNGLGQPGRARRAIRATFIFGVIGSVSVAAILALGVWRSVSASLFESAILASVGGIASLWVLPLALQNLQAETFRGLKDIRLATIFGGNLAGGSLFTVLLSSCLFGALWASTGRASLREVLLISVLASLGSAAVSAVLLSQRVKTLGDEESGAIRNREILLMAWPLLITNVAYFVFSQVDLWILGIFKPEQVAIYGAASKLLILVSASMLVVNAIVPALIAEQYALGNKSKLEHVLRLTATCAGIPVLVFLLVFVVFGSQLLGLLYGDYYESGAESLVLLSLGQIVAAWSGSSGLALVMTGHQTTIMKVAILSGVITVVLALLLVANFGAVGVAAASAMGISFQSMVLWLKAREQTGLWTHMRYISTEELSLFVNRLKGLSAK